MTANSYPDLSKSDLPERKDALVPDPQEFDFSDPEQAEEARTACASAEGRIRLFERLAGISQVGRTSMRRGCGLRWPRLFGQSDG